jgi:hypothetical protein
MPNPRSSGLPHAHQYSVNEESELVLDEVTGLSWQRSADPGPGEMGGFVWQDAVAHCDALVQGRYDDFRLPTRLELVSIVDPSSADPAIDPDAFPDTPSQAYWTASPVAIDSERSFSVNFSFGTTSTSLRVSEQAVRCVRSTPAAELPPGDRFRVQGDKVFDGMTGLRWQRSPTFLASSFGDSKEYCSALVIDGDRSFRVPSVKELQTLVDKTRRDVAIDPVAFPESTGDSYWSSTFLASDPESAWLVRFSDGHSRYDVLDVPNLVRCVR